jgi:hypothetical protein
MEVKKKKKKMDCKRERFMDKENRELILTKALSKHNQHSFWVPYGALRGQSQQL